MEETLRARVVAAAHLEPPPQPPREASEDDGACHTGCVFAVKFVWRWSWGLMPSCVFFFSLSPRPRGYFGGLVAVRAAVHLYISHAVKSLPVLSHALYLRPETWNSIPPVTLNWKWRRVRKGRESSIAFYLWCTVFPVARVITPVTRVSTSCCRKEREGCVTSVYSVSSRPVTTPETSCWTGLLWRTWAWPFTYSASCVAWERKCEKYCSTPSLQTSLFYLLPPAR